MIGRVQQGLAVLAVVWAIIAAFGAVRGARAQPPDPMEQLEAEFKQLAKDLPPAGEVGYLERYEDAGAEDAVRAHYAAQYALVPRVILSRVGLEFMIVAQGTRAARSRSAARRVLPGVERRPRIIGCIGVWFHDRDGRRGCSCRSGRPGGCCELCVCARPPIRVSPPRPWRVAWASVCLR